MVVAFALVNILAFDPLSYNTHGRAPVLRWLIIKNSLNVENLKHETLIDCQHLTD